MDDALWNLVSFRRSKNRRKIMEGLDRSPAPMTPTDIANRTKIGLPNTSRAVKALREHGLIECLNPDEPNFRHYTLTEKWGQVLKQERSNSRSTPGPMTPEPWYMMSILQSAPAKSGYRDQLASSEVG